ncbi:MAG: hypothetical protein GX609_02235 [Actinomycetales bacterium]|nr:hypothetical protein [Actinomycetales bacterium]
MTEPATPADPGALPAAPAAPPRRLVLAPLAAAGWGLLAAGVGLGLTLLAVRLTPAEEGWTDIVVGALGLIASVGLGVTVWLGLLARAAARLFSRGRRLAPVIASAAAVLALVVAWSLLAPRVGDGGAPSSVAEALALLPLVLAVAAPSAVFAWWGRGDAPAA